MSIILNNKKYISFSPQQNMIYFPYYYERNHSHAIKNGISK